MLNVLDGVVVAVVVFVVTLVAGAVVPVAVALHAWPISPNRCYVNIKCQTDTPPTAHQTFKKSIILITSFGNKHVALRAITKYCIDDIVVVVLLIVFIRSQRFCLIL